MVATGQTDRLVVVFSHHGIDTMTNIRELPTGAEASRLVGGPELRDLLHRFENVISG